MAAGCVESGRCHGRNEDQPPRPRHGILAPRQFGPAVCAGGPRFGNRQKVAESRFERIRRARTAHAEIIGDDKRLCTRPPLCDQFPAAGFDSPAELVRKMRQRICMLGSIVSIEKLFVLFAQFIERGFLLAAVFGFVLLAGRKCKFRQPVPCGDISRLFAGQRGESTFLDVDISLACSRPRSKLGYFRRVNRPSER